MRQQLVIVGSILLLGLLEMPVLGQIGKRLDSLYQSQVHQGLPVRVMSPDRFDETKKYPVIVSLHGAGGTGTDNQKQLKDWNRQLADPKRRRDFPCYVIAPQADGLWNAAHFNKTKALIAGLPSVDRDRIYVMGHSMGGHGTYLFIQLAPGYFAAAAPSAGSGRKRTGDFIDPAKIKDVPIWAFHGDEDRVCPITRDQTVLAEMKKKGGNMKLTTWVGDRHNVSGKMIVGAANGKTEFSGERCDREPDFMTWLFAQSLKQRLPKKRSLKKQPGGSSKNP
jgi:predicted peptidase